jgi:Flp pilus assembly protein TadG
VRARLASDSGERGAISALVVGLIVMLFVVAGLVVDGGLAINARQRVYDDAEQAARAGANQVDTLTLRTSGVVTILPAQAHTAAVDYLIGRGYDPGRIQVSVQQNEVTVTAEETVDTTLLQLIFISSFDVSGSATARPATGILTEVP